jgi:protein involved in polysaccharide export with SLBB domain
MLKVSYFVRVPEILLMSFVACAVFAPQAIAQEKMTVEQLKAMADKASPTPADIKGGFDPLKYTLGPEDVVEIAVMRHPEFSGTYPIDQEGKLQYKFVGDMQVTGMTKVQLEEKIREIISKFVIAPEVNVTITEYKSKVFYVIGEVGSPGKYYMRSESISVRDAIVMAGLPTQAAAMRKARIITPDQKGGKVQPVDIYGLLYGGDLKKNLTLYPGDFLYMPSTVMAKVFRVISPASSAVATAVSPVSSVAAAQNDAPAARGNTNR